MREVLLLAENSQGAFHQDRVQRSGAVVATADRTLNSKLCGSFSPHNRARRLQKQSLWWTL